MDLHAEPGNHDETKGPIDDSRGLLTAFHEEDATLAALTAVRADFLQGVKDKSEDKMEYVQSLCPLDTNGQFEVAREAYCKYVRAHWQFFGEVGRDYKDWVSDNEDEENARKAGDAEEVEQSEDEETDD